MKAWYTWHYINFQIRQSSSQLFCWLRVWWYCVSDSSWKTGFSLFPVCGVGKLTCGSGNKQAPTTLNHAWTKLCVCWYSRFFACFCFVFVLFILCCFLFCFRLRGYILQDNPWKSSCYSNYFWWFGMYFLFVFTNFFKTSTIPMFLGF